MCACLFSDRNNDPVWKTRTEIKSKERQMKKTPRSSFNKTVQKESEFLGYSEG